MGKEKILPLVLLIMQMSAAVPYGVQGDWRRCGYWIAAGFLTFFVTW